MAASGVDGSKNAVELEEPSANEPENEWSAEEIHVVPTVEISLVNAADDGMTQAGLPPGWIEQVEETSGNIYFYNEVTYETQWERPAWPGDSSAEDVDQSKNAVESEEPTVLEPELPGNAHVITEVPVLDSPSGTTADDGRTQSSLLPGWIEQVEEVSGDRYYYNQVTYQTQWERPTWPAHAAAYSDVDDGISAFESEEPAASEFDATLKVLPAECDHDTSNNLPSIFEKLRADSMEQQPDGIIEPPLLRAEPPNNDRSIDSVDPTAGKTDSVDPFDDVHSRTIPSWPLEMGTAHGDFNESLPPKIAATTANDTIPVANTSQETDASNTMNHGATSETHISGYALPSGWVELIDATSGNPYFLNESTNEATWERQVDAAIYERQEALTSDDLSQGWVEQFDESGRVYYVNQTLGLTQWERPAAAAAPLRTSRTRTPPALGAVDSGSDATQGATINEKTHRPAHAICSFGFGGRLCVWRASGNRPVEIHRTHNVVPSHALVQIEKMKEQAGISGPLSTSCAQSVEAYIEGKTEEKPADLLWRLIHIVAKSKGRIRSQSGIANSNSPEAAIVELMLKDGTMPVNPTQAGRNGNTAHNKSMMGGELGKNGECE
jgi:WW domain